MITATSPIFTVFFARMFVKEPIFILDLVNVVFIIFGMVLIVKPSFLFGSNDQFAYDSNGIYALIGVVCGSVFLNSNVSVVLRLLKGLIILLFISNTYSITLYWIAHFLIQFYISFDRMLSGHATRQGDLLDLTDCAWRTKNIMMVA